MHAWPAAYPMALRAWSYWPCSPVRGCYHYQVAAAGPAGANPSTFPQSTTLRAVFWGLVQDQALTRVCTQDEALERVRTTSNFGYTLLTVVTLGLWAPVQVEYACANPTPATGTIGEVHAAKDLAASCPAYHHDWPAGVGQRPRQRHRARDAARRPAQPAHPQESVDPQGLQCHDHGPPGLVAQALAANVRLRAVGAGWSLSGGCGHGRLAAPRSPSTSRSVWTHRWSSWTPRACRALRFVQCGVGVAQLSGLLRHDGLSLKTSGANNGQTLAGAISTGTHGAALDVGAMQDAVCGLHLIPDARRSLWLERPVTRSPRPSPRRWALSYGAMMPSSRPPW